MLAARACQVRAVFRQSSHRLDSLQSRFEPLEPLVDDPETLLGPVPRPTAERPAKDAAKQGTDDP